MSVSWRFFACLGMVASAVSLGAQSPRLSITITTSKPVYTVGDLFALTSFTQTRRQPLWESGLLPVRIGLNSTMKSL